MLHLTSEEPSFFSDLQVPEMPEDSTIFIITGKEGLGFGSQS